MATAKITILSESMKGTSFPLTENQYVIGRVDSADITIPDPTISSHHCTLLKKEDGSFSLRDDNSTNGTWVNGEKLENAEITLKAGDIMRFGGIEVLFDTDSPQKAAHRTSSVINLEETGTLRLDDNPLKNLGNQAAAKRSVALRENKKQNLILYSALGAFALVVVVILIIVIAKMLGGGN